MLPEFLSNNLCSLIPDMDRMVLVCDMVVSVDGDILATSFMKQLSVHELVLHMKIFGKSLRMMI